MLGTICSGKLLAWLAAAFFEKHTSERYFRWSLFVRKTGCGAWKLRTHWFKIFIQPRFRVRKLRCVTTGRRRIVTQVAAANHTGLHQIISHPVIRYVIVYMNLHFWPESRDPLPQINTHRSQLFEYCRWHVLLEEWFTTVNYFAADCIAVPPVTLRPQNTP